MADRSLARNSESAPTGFDAQILLNTRYVQQLVLPDNVELTEELVAQVMQSLDYALYSATTWPSARDLILSVAPKMEKAGYRREWLHYLQVAAQLSRKYKDDAATADITFQLGYLSQLLGKLDVAHEAFDESATHYLLTNQLTDYAKALNRQAYVARLQRRHADAEKLVGQALGILGQNHPARQLSYFVLGNIAIDGKEGQLAESYFQQSLELCQQQGDLRLVAQRLGNLGLAAEIQKEYQHAQSYYEQAIALFGDLGDSVQQAQMRMNLGNAYLNSGSPQKAISLYDLAYPVIQKVQDRLHLAMLATNRGIACREAGQWDKAEQSLRSAISRWQQFNNRRSESNATQELALVYLEQGQKEKAILLLNQALTILNEISGDPGYQSLYDAISTRLQVAKSS